MQVLSVGKAHPEHYYEQDELIEFITEFWAEKHHNIKRVEQFHRAVMVGGRHLSLPLPRYRELSGFGEANDAFIEVGTAVGEKAVRDALEQAGLQAQDVDIIFCASVTGIAAPSIDARLVARLGFRPDIKRVPIFGLGCVAGAAGTARLFDYLRGDERGVGLLLCVELCSLTAQGEDFSVANLISSGLFGDGAAALLAVGNAHPAAANARGPKVLASKSSFYLNTERVMGWDIGDSGFRIVLADTVPAVVKTYVRGDVDGFLAEQNMTIDDISSWVCHPGGPKVLDAFAEVLDLEKEDLIVTWNSLAEVGNLSSASVLMVLRDTIAQKHPPRGSHGLMLAMGPGFCSESVLLEW